jgi:diguanylate cyclase (GGDEF)-like protein/PAS domain S-box-containing protein
VAAPDPPSHARSAEDALKETERAFQTLLDNLPGFAYRCRNEPSWPIEAVSGGFAALTGYDPAQLLDGTVRYGDLIHPDDRGPVWNEVQAGLGERRRFQATYRIRTRAGAETWVWEQGQGVWSAQGELTALEGLVLDVSARKAAESELVHAREQFRLLTEHSWDIVHVQDADRVITYISPSVQRILGFSPEEMVGKRGALFVHPDDQPFVRHIYAGEMLQPGATSRTEFRLVHRDGSLRTVEVFSRNTAAPGQPPYVISYTRDVTEQRDMEAELRRRALYDPLTGLPNRTLLLDRLGHALALSGDADDDVCALLFLDLDRFKRVNDSLGHTAGDRLLAEVGRRIQSVARPEDTAARLGGDEFALLVQSARSEGSVMGLAARLQAAVSAPAALNGSELIPSASIGVALIHPGYADADEVLRDADIAMYSAKARGRGLCAVFAPTMHESAVGLLETETALRRALDRAEFRTFFQPIVSAGTEALVGWEALVRWQHPERGLLGPGAFLPVAEDSGLVVHIDRWVLRDALRQLRAWREGFPGSDELFVSVNVSGSDFDHPGLVHDVETALREWRIPPGCLRLEVTESVLIDHVAADSALRQVKALGVRVDLDDFGTGYSSLSYLSRFAVDALKIDRSFVASLHARPESRAIVGAIVSLARSLELEGTTAEGVESRGQADALHAAGCTYLQGYAFSPPLPASDAEAWMVARSANGGAG